MTAETLNPQPIKAGKLQAGDLIDLEGDRYADPDDDTGGYLSFEYARVESTERETRTCVRVDFDKGSFGFPPDHEFKIVNPLPRASVHDTNTNEHVGTFYGSGAEDRAAELIDSLGLGEYDLSVSDTRCGECGESFWHEAGPDCPACGATVKP